MFMRRVIFITLILLVLSVHSTYADSPCWSAVYGEVLQVYPEQLKLLIQTKHGKQILELRPDCQILRSGQEVSIVSLRPVTSNSFQEVLCLMDPKGFVTHLFAHYCIQECTDGLVFYDIFGHIKKIE